MDSKSWWARPEEKSSLFFMKYMIPFSFLFESHFGTILFLLHNGVRDRTDKCHQNYFSALSFTAGFYHLLCRSPRWAMVPKTGFHPHPPVVEALTRRGRVGRVRTRIHSSELVAVGDSLAVLQDEPHSGAQLWRHQGPCCRIRAVVAMLLLSSSGQVSLLQVPHASSWEVRAARPLPEQREWEDLSSGPKGTIRRTPPESYDKWPWALHFSLPPRPGERHTTTLGSKGGGVLRARARDASSQYGKRKRCYTGRLFISQANRISPEVATLVIPEQASYSSNKYLLDPSGCQALEIHWRTKQTSLLPSRNSHSNGEEIVNKTRNRKANCIVG